MYHTNTFQTKGHVDLVSGKVGTVMTVHPDLLRTTSPDRRRRLLQIVVETEGGVTTGSFCSGL